MATVSAPATMTAEDHRRLVIEFNETAAPCPRERTVVDLFEAQVARTPDVEAIRHGSRELTYRQLSDAAGLVASALRARGVGPGRLVVLYMEQSIEVVSAILGVLQTGAAYVPLDTDSPAERVAFVMQDIASAIGGALPVVLIEPHLASRLPNGLAAEVVVVGHDSPAPRAGLRPEGGARAVSPEDLAYVIYTSGSTGRPKGVVVEHRSLVNYIWWAKDVYCRGERLAWPLFSSLAFDLTVTSIFVPLITGGRIVVHKPEATRQSMAIRDVIEANSADVVKLTPAHLALIRDMPLAATRIRRLVVGGENFGTELARDITRQFGRPVEIYNEYGPTEATVGCMLHLYDPDRDLGRSVPIGRPAANTSIFVLDDSLSPAPVGTVGEMCIAGDGLSRGYLGRPALTAEAFVDIDDPRALGASEAGASSKNPLRIYKTGDLARWDADGRLEFLGRRDQQLKIRGARVEPGEIEAQLLDYPAVRQCLVGVFRGLRHRSSETVTHCARCGLASDAPGVAYDEAGVCNLCRAYEAYADKAQAYFKTRRDLDLLVERMTASRRGSHDCVVLLSGGKDSTYMVYQLCALGLHPLAFTLDNGYISEGALANIRRTVDALGLELVVGRTPHMNAIFVDSLKRFANVCNGCFKTIYTLALDLARERGLRFVVTGLSRGQFFETRLTEEIFQRPDMDASVVDDLVLEARKAYHRREDAVTSRLGREGIDEALAEIEFVDFYRYWSAPLAEIKSFLSSHTPWIRPADTGRSTNCRINEVGIYLHKKRRGFHNYALPYSWDVRLGQKTRDEAMAELEDDLDEDRARAILAEIGYADAEEDGADVARRLAAFFVSDADVAPDALRAHMRAWLPDYMVPDAFVRVPAMPLTANGKIDREALAAALSAAEGAGGGEDPPRNPTEREVAAIWREILQLPSVGAHDDFFDVGGQSLGAVRVMSRIQDAFGVAVPLRTIFDRPTVAALAEAIDSLAWAAAREGRTVSPGEREEIDL